ncbi:hypothetical protein [Frankia sp. R82]|uniref:hypothetical protein n=1 Tax=Frankia sp. R82 TaxID=2950553 RepID=UPI002042E7A4|nr:hypothetical protein [Frankia sp. R82]MCM3885269.1 hypothetical protein [Frankia sp. R82]
MPAAIADDTLTVRGSPTAEQTTVGPDLTTVLGCPGRTFAAWAKDNLDTFR